MNARVREEQANNGEPSTAGAERDVRDALLSTSTCLTLGEVAPGSRRWRVVITDEMTSEDGVICQPGVTLCDIEALPHLRGKTLPPLHPDDVVQLLLQLHRLSPLLFQQSRELPPVAGEIYLLGMQSAEALQHLTRLLQLRRLIVCDIRPRALAERRNASALQRDLLGRHLKIPVLRKHPRTNTFLLRERLMEETQRQLGAILASGCSLLFLCGCTGDPSCPCHLFAERVRRLHWVGAAQKDVMDGHKAGEGGPL